ncbi:MAG: hypothetical protein JW797_13805 [Bradymonadales bacterium]|nr:hypothetical protein [Bradymonadales bacterium]
MNRRWCARSSWLATLAAICLLAGSAFGEPAVTQVIPDSVPRGGRTTLQLIGTELDQADHLIVSDWRIEASILSVAAEEIVAELAVSQRAVAGPRDLAISFVPGTELLIVEAFEVVAGPAMLLSVSPQQLVRDRAEIVDLVGFNLDAVQSVDGGGGVLVEEYTPSVDPTRATVTFTADHLAALGSRDVTLWGAAGEADTLESALTVVPGALTVDALTPSTATRGDARILHAVGQNLDTVQSVLLGNGILVRSIQLLDPTALDLSIEVLQTALPVGTGRDATFLGQGEERFTLSQALTVQAGPLTLLSIRPGEVSQGSEVALTLDGTNLDGLTSFSAGEEVQLVELDPISPVRAVVDIAVASEAATGYRSVTVQGQFGQSTLPEALRVTGVQDLPPRINYPDLLDFGRVEVGARQRSSLILFNENPVYQDVTLEIASGDIRDFCLQDPEGMTMEELCTSVLAFQLSPLGEAVIGVEFRPSLQLYSEVTLSVMASEQSLGGSTLRGRGIESVLSFYPPAPISIPPVVEGEIIQEQISTLTRSLDPTRIREVQLVMERDGLLYPEADERSEISLSDPPSPEEEPLFGSTLVTVTFQYPVGTYEGEVRFLTDRSTAPIVPLSLYAAVIPASSEEPADSSLEPVEEVGDPAEEWESDARDQAVEPPPEVADLDLAEESEDILEPQTTSGQEGCCAQVPMRQVKAVHLMGAIALLALWGATRRRGCRPGRRGTRQAGRIH